MADSLEDLHQLFGEFTFQWNRIIEIRERALSVIKQVESGQPFDHESAVRTVEMLEMLAVRVSPLFKTTWLPTVSIILDRSHAEVHQHLYTYPDDIVPILRSLPAEILRFKESLARRLRDVCTDSNDTINSQKLCLYCNWAFARIARDVKGRNASVYHRPLIWLQFLWRRCEPASPRGQALRGAAVTVQPDLLSDYHQLRWEFDIDTTDETLVSNELHLLRAPQETALSPSNVDLIHQCLEAAVVQQKTEIPLRSFAPKRLLDLGPERDSCPSLVVSSTPTVSPIRYAALSYCWGGPEEAARQLKSTTISAAKHCSGIPVDSMTPVMRDAVITCRALGIRYLWCDAVCILQDDDRDWEEQSRQMDDIFSNSWVTICALAGSSCLQGFLDRNPSGGSAPVQLGYLSPTNPHIRGLYRIRPVQRSYKRSERNTIRAIGKPPLTRDLVLSEWNERGWILQEKLLAPRKLYFGSEQLHFHHGQFIRSEDGSISSSDQRPLTPLEDGDHWMVPFDVSIEALRAQRHHVWDVWYQVARQAGGMKWTRKDDLFPGLSGLAARFSEAVKDKYVAGLWVRDLHRGLLWNTGRRGMRSARCLCELLGSLAQGGSGPNFAPSWSWASRQNFGEFVISVNNLPCRVQTHLCPEFTLLEARVVPDGVNPFGRIKTASLRFTGKLTDLVSASHQIQDWIHRKEWVIFQRGTCVHIWCDWLPDKHYPCPKDCPLQSEQHARLRLLLISSCCSDYKELDGGAGDDRPELDLVRDPDCRRYPRSYTSILFKSGYCFTWHNDNEAGEVARSGCHLCSGKGRTRDIWGLLVYPAGRPDTYYRVGLFLCRSEYGGSRLFDQAKTETLELI